MTVLWSVVVYVVSLGLGLRMILQAARRYGQ
jgi:hypothetical protein